MNKFFHSLLAVIFLLSLLPAHAVEKSAARSEWMNGFMKMEEADKAASNPAAALALYKGALDIFESVQRKYPDWNPALLNYRINYCQKKIAETTSLLNSQAGKLSPDKLLELTQEQAKSIQALESAKKELNARVTFLTDALQRARSEAASSASLENTAASLAADKKNLEQRLARVELELKNKNAQLTTAEKQGQNADSYKKELLLTQKRLEATSEDLTDIKDKAAKLKREFDLLQKDLKLAQRQKEDLETALKVARQLTESHLADIQTLNGKLKSAQEKLTFSEKLAEEKEQLVADLKRQLLASQADTENARTQLKRETSAWADYRKKQEAELAELTQAKQEREKELADIQKAQDAAVAQAERTRLEMAAAVRKAEQALLTETRKAEEDKLSFQKEQQISMALAKKAQEQALAQLKESQAKMEVNYQKQELALKDELEQSKKVRLALEKENSSLQKQLESTTAQLTTLKTADNEKNESLQLLRTNLEQERTKSVHKDEKSLEVASQVARLSSKLELAEKNNLRLSTELEEAKIILAKRKQDGDSSASAQQTIAQKQAEIQAYETKLQSQLQIARRQEEELARLNKEVGTAQAALKASNDKVSQASDALKANQDKLKETQDRLDDATRKLAYAQKDNQVLAAESQKAQQGAAQEHIELLALRRDKDELTKLKEAHQRLLDKNSDLTNELNVAQNKNRQLDSLEDEIAKLTRHAKNTEENHANALTQLNDTLERKKTELDAMAEKYGALEKRLQQERQAFELKYKEIDSRSSAGNASLQKQLAEARHYQQEAEDLRTQLKNSQNALQAANELHNKENSTLKLQLKQAENQQHDYQKQLDADKSENERLNTLVAKLTLDKNSQANTIQTLNSDINVLKDNVKLAQAQSEAARGISQNLQETEDKVKQLEKQLEQEKNDARLAAEKLEARHAAVVTALQNNETFLRNQLKEKDDTLQAIRNNNENLNGPWLDKIKGISEKYEKESKRRMALETALMEMEDKIKKLEAKAQQDARQLQAQHTAVTEDTHAQLMNQLAQSSQNHVPQDAEARMNRERERQTLVRGFLRQGTDSERQKKIEAARFNYQKALELDPDNKIALQRMGVIAFQLGNNQEATKYLKQSFKFDPDDSDTLLALGYALARTGKADWAISYLSRAAALKPDDPYTAGAYGSALLNMGWTQPAEKQLIHAHNLKPTDADSAFNLALLYITAEPPRYDQASKWYDIAVKNGAERDPGIESALKN